LKWYFGIYYSFGINQETRPLLIAFISLYIQKLYTEIDDTQIADT
jgi:hypothetical protein